MVNAPIVGILRQICAAGKLKIVLLSVHVDIRFIVEKLMPRSDYRCMGPVLSHGTSLKRAFSLVTEHKYPHLTPSWVLPGRVVLGHWSVQDAQFPRFFPHTSLQCSKQSGGR